MGLWDASKPPVVWCHHGILRNAITSGISPVVWGPPWGAMRGAIPRVTKNHTVVKCTLEYLGCKSFIRTSCFSRICHACELATFNKFHWCGKPNAIVPPALKRHLWFNTPSHGWLGWCLALGLTHWSDPNHCFWGIGLSTSINHYEPLSAIIRNY